MSNVIEPPITPSGEQLVELAVERLRETYPNWNPNPASPEYRMFLALAEMIAELMILAFDVPEAIIRFVGALVYQEPIIPSEYAIGKIEVHAKDSLGHLLSAGEQFLIKPISGTPLAFEVIKDTKIEPGFTEVTFEVRAIDPGPESNVTGSTETEPDEPLAWISSSEVTENPSGGSAEETIEAYTQRIVELARLIAPRPILPEDFANYVRLLTTKERVLRAVAIDLLELETASEEGFFRTKVNGSGEGTSLGSGVERCVTVIAINEKGEHLGTAARKEAEDKVRSAREATFKFFLAGPSINTITVEVKATVLKGYNKASTETAVEEALKTYLNPTTWGVPPTGDLTSWVNRKHVYYQEVSRAILDVPGVGHWTVLKVNGGEGDVLMTGIAPLPKVGTLTIALTEGSE